MEVACHGIYNMCATLRLPSLDSVALCWETVHDCRRPGSTSNARHDWQCTVPGELLVAAEDSEAGPVVGQHQMCFFLSVNGCR